MCMRPTKVVLRDCISDNATHREAKYIKKWVTVPILLRVQQLRMNGSMLP